MDLDQPVLPARGQDAVHPQTGRSELLGDLRLGQPLAVVQPSDARPKILAAIGERLRCHLSLQCQLCGRRLRPTPPCRNDGNITFVSSSIHLITPRNRGTVPDLGQSLPLPASGSPGQLGWSLAEPDDGSQPWPRYWRPRRRTIVRSAPDAGGIRGPTTGKEVRRDGERKNTG